MQRREAVLASEQNRKPKKLMESDYLLGVHDVHRMGALRFKLEETGAYLDDNHMLSAPSKWIIVSILNWLFLWLTIFNSINQQPKISIGKWFRRLINGARWLNNSKSVIMSKKLWRLHLWHNAFDDLFKLAAVEAISGLDLPSEGVSAIKRMVFRSSDKYFWDCADPHCCNV